MCCLLWQGNYDPDQVESKIMNRILLSIRHESVKCILDINQDIIKVSLGLIYAYALITRKKINFFK